MVNVISRTLVGGGLTLLLGGGGPLSVKSDRLRNRSKRVHFRTNTLGKGVNPLILPVTT